MVALAAVTAVVAVARAVWVCHPWCRTRAARLRAPGSAPVRVVAVFGSGGHTAEMLTLLAALPADRYTPVAYVAADTDVASEPAARGAGLLRPDTPLYRITRSREVGGSFVRAAFKGIAALAQSLTLLARHAPGVLLLNGPGTAFPVAAAALTLRYFDIADVHVVYVESIARVGSLSLTGKLLYPVADAFYVQWPALAAAYPRAIYVGMLK